jgi:MFS family permease
MVFGAGACVAAVLHPVFGRVAGAWGGRTLTLRGMVAIGLVLPLFPLIGGFGSAVAIYVVGAIAIATFVTPSLSYMAEALSAAGSRSYGVAYGVYNVAWALGLLVGPALGGFLYERVAFGSLTIAWASVVALLALALARLGSPARG